MFVRNCWYVIAWDHEVPVDGLFSRRVLGEPILLYRTAAGAVVALEDRCCHRLAPLSKGRREGDCVRCGYHGLKFDPSGTCVEIPGQDTVPPAARVRRYPVAERRGWVFVWPGEPSLADTALLPDNVSCRHPDWRNLPGYLHYETNWQLICDNLLDFSHLSYVHEKTLGGSTAIAQSRADVERVPRGVRVSRFVEDVPPAPFNRQLRDFTGHIDRWFVYDFLLPGTLLMRSGGRPTGADPADDARLGFELHSCQTLTPETEHTTHYFFQQSHRADQGDDTTAKRIFDALVVAFEEDRAMITAQSRVIAADPDARMLPLPMDRAVIEFRRVVDAARAAERAAR